MRKWLLSLLTVFCAFGLTGCWDRVEVKDLALVIAKGIDKGPDNRVSVCIQTAVPSGVGGGGDGGSTASGPGKSFVFATATGENIRDADQHLQEQLPRRIYLAHRRILVIGEDEAKAGLKDILDQFGRDPQNRMRDLLIIAKGGTAKDFLTMPTVIEKIPGQEMRTIEKQEAGSVITILDFLRRASSEGTVPLAAAMEKKNNPAPGEQAFFLTSTAVMKNLQLVGYLNDEETRGVMWLRGKIGREYITADIPEQGTITLFLIGINRKIEPVLTQGRVEFNVQVSGKGEVVENNTKLDISSKETYAMIKSAFEDEAKRYIQESFLRAQEYDSDVFGFGNEIYRTHPRAWQEMRQHWDELFKDAKLNLSVDIEPLRTGMSGPPLQLKEDEVKKIS